MAELNLSKLPDKKTIPAIDLSGLPDKMSDVTTAETSDSFNSVIKTPEFIEAFNAGFRSSVTGLIYSGKAPDMPKDQKTINRIASQVGTLAGDFPWMVTGAVIAAPAGGPGASMAGAFALPAGLRKVYMDMYQKGRIKTFGEFWNRLTGAMWETEKGLAVGGATGGIGKVVPGLGSVPAEVATMVTTGAAMEGQIPEPEEFLDAAVIIGGLRGARYVNRKLSATYSKNGRRPIEVIDDMKFDPTIKEDLLSKNQDTPRAYKEKKAEPIEEKPKVVKPEEPVEPPPEKPLTLESAVEDAIETISVGEKTKKATTFTDFYTAMIDDVYPLMAVLKKAGLEKTEAGKNPYILARLMRGWSGKADHFLEYSPFRFSDLENVKGKPLAEIVKPYADNLNELRAYLRAERDIELNDRGIESGFPIEKAEVIVDGLRNKYSGVKSELQAYQDSTLKYLEDSGILSGDAIDLMRKANREYVPFYRVMEDAKTGGTGKGLEARQPVRRIKGSERRIIDPLESIIKNTYLYINLAEKNRIGTTLIEGFEQAGLMDKYAVKVKTKVHPIALSPKEIKKILGKVIKIKPSRVSKITSKISEKVTGVTEKTEEGTSKNIAKVEAQAKEALLARGYSDGEASQIINRIKTAEGKEASTKIIEKTIENITEIETMQEFSVDLDSETISIFRPNAFTPQEDIISIWRNGERENYRVHPDIARTMKGLDRESASMLVRLLSVPTKWLRAGAILAPEFIGRNPIRDQMSAFIYSKHGFIPGFDFVKGVWDMTVMKNKGVFYKEYIKAGALQSFFVSPDRPYLQKVVKDLTQSPIRNGVKYLKNPIEGLRVLSELSEMGTRLGEFGAARKKGATIFKAGFEAREVSLDFGRKGAKARAMNQLIAFWNANVQGLDKTVRVFKDEPVATSVKVMAGITIPSILLAIANHDDKRVQDIPRWQRDLFWIVPTKDTIYRIPKPFEIGILFGTIPERIVEHILNIDPNAFNGLLEAVGRGAMPGIVPTVALPIMENWANKSLFLDRPIVPYTREKLLPEFQYKPYTTEIAKSLGSLIGTLPNDVKMFDTTKELLGPAKIENLIRGWTGGLGVHILQLADYGLRKAGVLPDDKIKPTKTLSDIPFIKAFVVRYPSSSTENINTFYDNYFRSQKLKDTANALVKEAEQEGSTEKYQESIAFMEKHLFEMEGLKEIYDSLRNQNNAIRMIYANPNIDPDEKRQLIDGIYYQMTTIAKHGNDVVDEIKKYSQ